MHGGGERLVVFDQDAAGPGGSDQRAILALLQAPDVKVLGLSIVTGNAWMPVESAHTLRMLELIGRRDIDVYPGALWPLLRRRDDTLAAQRAHGRVAWLGAFSEPGPPAEPATREDRPELAARSMNAASFLLSAVRAYPGRVTVIAAGPLTNLALAQRLDPEFARLARALVVMGGSIASADDGGAISTRPTHEFNFWFDPEAAHIVLTAPWRRITVTPLDVALRTRFTDAMHAAIGEASSPAARYLTYFDRARDPMWDELTVLAWRDPSLITRSRALYLDVDLGRGANYGNTLAWTAEDKPDHAGAPADVQIAFDRASFEAIFVESMRVTPTATDAPAIMRFKP